MSSKLRKKETVTISKEEYDELLDEVFFLRCCEQEGLDEWFNYDYAVQSYNKAKGIEDD